MKFTTGIAPQPRPADPRALDGELLAADQAAPWFHDDADVASFMENRNAVRVLGDGDFGALGFGAPTASGQVVGPESSLRVGAAYACRRVIAEDIAKLPRRVVKTTRNPNTGRTRADIQHDHPVHILLTVAPNDWMTPFEFVEYMVGVATFHSGAYALLRRDDSGRLTEILPMLPGTCGPEYDQFWQVSYRASGYGTQEVFEPHEILRLNGHMADPWRGQPTIAIAREAVGLAAAIEASQARFHANDLRPAGVLTTSNTLKNDEQRDAIRAAWLKAYGPGGSGGIAVLDAGFDYKAMTAEASKNEVIVNRKFQINEICRFFRVFPTAIGHSDGSQSFASVEAFFTAHAQHTLQPWVRRVEEAMTLCLLTAEERRAGLRVDLDMDAILRGTPTDETNMLEKQVKFLITPNEARIKKGMDPIENDPDMDRVQISRNNTGTQAAPIATPAAPVSVPDGEVIV